MNPREYFYGPFSLHFERFMLSLHEHGSCSRMKSHKSQNFFGSRLGSPISSQFSDKYFSVGDLWTGHDHLSDLTQEDQANFLCAIFYTTLIDQVMYSHRKDDYKTFKALTKYPKMDRTIGWARTMMMANPYEIFGMEITSRYHLNEIMISIRFSKWAVFIVSDMKEFFASNRIGKTTWEQIRDAMLSDNSCTIGEYGALLRQQLLNQKP